MTEQTRAVEPATEPARTMLELIDAAISGAWKHAAGDVDPVDMRVEIVRRLELIDRFGGTEAADIKAILATGDTVKWVYGK